MKYKDITGQKFGTLVAQEIVGQKRGRMVWRCICDCGNHKDVLLDYLMQKNVKSCGKCQRSTLPKDLLGKRFGMLLVLSKAPNLRNNKTAWFCKCDCGTEKAIKTANLLTGKAQSCGCQVNYNKVNYTNKRFGRLLVGVRAGCKNSHNYYICKCDCGNELLVSSSHLKAGRTRSCGCLRKDMLSKLQSSKIGILNQAWKGGTSLSNRKCKEYQAWRKQVLSRDKKTCQICGDCSEIEVHHLYAVAANPDKVYNIDNGVCICKTCHVIFHMEYGSGDNTPAQFEEFKAGLGLATPKGV